VKVVLNGGARPGEEVYNNILLINAVFVCDTTWSFHGIGKGDSLKKFLDSLHFRDQVNAFNNTPALKKQVDVKNEKAMVCLIENMRETRIFLGNDDTVKM